jgi:hypothetical protein
VVSAVIATIAAARFPGASCSCRQPEKNLLSPELSYLHAEPAEMSLFLPGEEAEVTGTGLAPINAGLPHPTAQATGGKAKPFSDGVAGKPSCGKGGQVP